MDVIFSRFSRLLNRRLDAGIHTTEDAVRYTFFYATKLPPASIILEGFHADVRSDRRRIDAVLLLPGNKRAAFEFKYHKALQTGGARPRPHQAGTILADMRRLHEYRADEKYLIYLTDPEMASYLRKSRNGLTHIFDISSDSVRIEPQLWKRKSATFVRSAGTPFRAEIEMAYKTALHKRYELRIWRVH